MCDRFPRKFDVETSYKHFLRVTYHTIVPLTEELYLLIKPELELHCKIVHRNVTNRKIFKLAFAKIHIRSLQLGEVNIAKLAIKLHSTLYSSTFYHLLRGLWSKDLFLPILETRSAVQIMLKVLFN